MKLWIDKDKKCFVIQFRSIKQARKIGSLLLRTKHDNIAIASSKSNDIDSKWVRKMCKRIPDITT